MPGESLSFDVYWNDRLASAGIVRFGEQVSNASGDVRSLSDGLDKLGAKSVKARVGLDGDKEANAELDKLDVRLIRLGNKVANPNITVEGKVRALAEIAAVDVAIDKLNRKTATVNIAQRASKLGFLQPSLGGTALALSPALIPLAGGIAAGIGAIGVSFGAATIGAGLFGLTARSVLTTASTNLTKLQALELAVNKATTAATKKSAEAALAALKNTFAPGYLALLGQLEKFKSAWTKTSQTIAIPALSVWLPVLTKAMPLLVTAVKPVADVFKYWGIQLNTYFTTPATAKHIKDIASAFGNFAAQQLYRIGQFIKDIGLGVFNLGKDLAASGANFNAFGPWLSGIGDAFLAWSKSEKARNDVRGFLKFLHDEGPVVRGILTDLKTVIPGIFAGATTTGTLELQALAGFMGLVAGLPAGWQKPLTEAAGAMLLLSKTGVVSVGLKLTGKLAEHPTAFGFSIGTLLAAGIIDAVNQHKPGEKSIWQRFSPPPKGQQQTWLNSWSGLGDRIVQIADDVRHGVSRIWDALWNHTLATTKQGDHDIAAEFGNLRHSVAAEWDRIWSGTVATVRSGVATVTAWFRSLPGKVLDALFGLGHSLYAFGHAALTELWNGIKSVSFGILGWFGGFVGKILGFLGKLTGHSPSGEFYFAGQKMMTQLAAGLRSRAHIAANAAKAAAHRVQSGALGGDALANQALARRIFPWGASQWPSFVGLVMGESGFNRFARNPTSGAYGIPQALPPTKLPFAGQQAGGSHAGPQLSWMFDYIRQFYGTPANAYSTWLSRSPHWYGSGLQGGLFTSPTLIGVGERGPEMVSVTPAGRGGGPVVVEFHAGPSEFDQFMLTWLRKAVRVRGGGDVQIAFGRN